MYYGLDSGNKVWSELSVLCYSSQSFQCDSDLYQDIGALPVSPDSQSPAAAPVGYACVEAGEGGEGSRAGVAEVLKAVCIENHLL